MRFLPLTFIVGIHGFALFVPYLLICVGVQMALKHR
jgi:hypothetical protein